MKQYIKSLLIIFILGFSINLKSTNTSCDPLLQLLEATLKDATHGPVWRAFLDDAASAGGLGTRTFEMVSGMSSITMRSNPVTLQGLRTAIARGVKSVDEILTHANVNWMDKSSITHIFRGDLFGEGLHHISGVISREGYSIAAVRRRTPEGFYITDILPDKANPLLKYEKSFWPDTWDETKIVDEIIAASNNNPILKSTTNGVQTFESSIVNSSQKIRYTIKADGMLGTAFPIGL